MGVEEVYAQNPFGPGLFQPCQLISRKCQHVDISMNNLIPAGLSVFLRVLLTFTQPSRKARHSSNNSQRPDSFATPPATSKRFIRVIYPAV